MSLIPAVIEKIQGSEPFSATHAVLCYLLDNAVGHENAKPLPVIVAALRERGIRMSGKKFQTTILQASRDADYFIGSGPKGFFLIDKMDDAFVMQTFYQDRILAENRNLENLRRQAERVGWTI